jgi:hypothetical protein
MILSLSMYFDDEDSYSQEAYPDLTSDEIVTMMKEDFIDTIRKQWDDEEIMEAIEVAAE